MRAPSMTRNAERRCSGTSVVGRMACRWKSSTRPVTAGVFLPPTRFVYN